MTISTSLGCICEWINGKQRNEQIRIPDSPAPTLRYPTGAQNSTEHETSQKTA